MAADVTLTIDDAELRRWIRAALPEARQGAATALTKTARSIGGRTVKGTAQKMDVLQKHIRRRVKVKPANASTLWARTRVYAKSLNPMVLGATQNKAPGGGVRARSYRWPGAFIARGIQGRRKVLRRRNLGDPASLPLTGLRVPMFQSAEEVVNVVAAREAQTLFNKTLPHEVMWRLRAAR